ncbi:hypothetical protein A1O3_03881 [Capronia epimyces CBS 606.96]|uniref:Heterokaryon incompatibility domain-containing protein n=1 Tax=Capronia epimyces CBS 606.96 TaxID=1182542 RepID=W9Y2A7_9EURO|nr:uncharacterized protein A1O3_03881 [Capronia epimyces CBS 606.96]EXJ86927.1 hypothetical protein A1O3_03881 [Capronia epimyces CBS 606.96]
MEKLSISPNVDQAVDTASTHQGPASLCGRCRDLNIKRVFQKYEKAVRRGNDYVVAELGKVEDMKQSSCPLCHFFASMALGRQTDKTCECILDEESHTFPDIDPSGHFELRAITVGHAYLGQERGEQARPDVSGLQPQVMLGLAPVGASGSYPGHHCWYRMGMIAPVQPDGDSSEYPPPPSTTASPSTSKGTRKEKAKAKAKAETKPWSLQTRRIVADQIPYHVLNGWLDQCRNHHEEECQPVRFKDPPCVKVIDCNTLEIVKAPQSCQYLALSYVWGSTQERGDGPVKKLDSENVPVLVMPVKMALVVTDSIEVTRRLGYRYLWIDKYCIDQEDAREKASQISCMDQIYECSVATIVAAGGKDSSFGLPGVTTRSRLPQPTVRVQGLTLRSTLPNPVYTVRRSGWMTRGWTYQEGIFSARRLFFTEHQVVFECRSTMYSEVFDHPAHIQVWQFQHDDSIVFGLADVGDGPPTMQQMVLCLQIEAYSGRNVTYDLDALNAFLSVFTRLRRLKRPIYHFYGVPIIKRRPGDDETGSDDDEAASDDDEDYSEGNEASSSSDQAEPEKEGDLKPVKSLMEALCWYHIPGSVGEKMTIRRRPTFPSWTWLGWTGRLSYTKFLGMPIDELEDVEVDVEDKDGRLWPWTTWLDVMQILALKDQDRLSGRLRVKGWLEQADIMSLGYKTGYYVKRKAGRWRRSQQLYLSVPGDPKRRDEEEEGEDDGNDDVMANLLPSPDTATATATATTIAADFLSLGPLMLLLKDDGDGQYSRWGVTGYYKKKRSSASRNSTKARPRDGQSHDVSHSSSSSSSSHRQWKELWLI